MDTCSGYFSKGEYTSYIWVKYDMQTLLLNIDNKYQCFKVTHRGTTRTIFSYWCIFRFHAPLRETFNVVRLCAVEYSERNIHKRIARRPAREL